MQSFKVASVAAVFAVLSTAAGAGEVQPFSALQGVEAQTMSSPEMNSVYGQLTLNDIRNAIERVPNEAVEALLTQKLNAVVAAHPAAVNAFLAYLTAHGH